MRSKLMPKGRLRAGSFYIVYVVMVSLILGAVIGQASFNMTLDYRLHQLETQISPVSVDSGEETNEVEGTSDSGLENDCLLKTEAEREMIERVVMAESMGEPFEGQVAVAQTIFDRAVLWNKTPVEVVSQESQYADMYSGEISDSVKQAVSAVFDHGYRAFEEPVTHFHADYVNPYWAEVKTSRGTIGSHRFYY